MGANAFAISRRLVDKGVDKSVADAVAEEIVTHSDENLATKADIVRLETKVNVLVTMVGGLYVAIGVVVLGNFIGGG